MNQITLLPTPDVYSQMKDIAAVAVKSGFLPAAINTPEKAVIIALKGYELGLPPMVAFSHIHVVNGKPGCSAELMLAGIRERYPQAEIYIAESTDKICKIEAKRPNEKKATTFSFTIEEAHNAKLTSKDVWKGYAVDMLRARCITRMKRAMFPEVMMGLSHTPEELEDIKDVTPNSQETAKTVEPEGIKTIKNYAPQTSEEAANWKPGQSTVSSDKPAPAQTETPKTKMTRTEMGAVIGAKAKEIGYTQETLKARIETVFQKQYQNLTDADLEQLIGILDSELLAEQGA